MTSVGWWVGGGIKQLTSQPCTPSGPDSAGAGRGTWTGSGSATPWWGWGRTASPRPSAGPAPASSVILSAINAVVSEASAPWFHPTTGWSVRKFLPRY